jgi:hypothetical protein
MINYVKYMYLYTVLLLVRASVWPGPLRSTGPTGWPGTMFLCACLARPYSYRAETGSGRVRAGWPVWTSIPLAETRSRG